jgi:antitoxin component YwqK of YwqJK toxin-antitoxin module
MKVIRQLLFAWMLVTFLVLEGFGQDAKPPPPPPPKPLPLPTKIITKSVSDENSSGNDDKLKLTTIKQRRTIKIPPRKPVPVLDWSDFTYNSPEEKAFWDKLPDWSDKRLYFPYSRFKRNARGETIDSNSSEGFNGYVRRKSYTQRTIYQFVDGYVVRSKTLNKGGKKRSALNYKNGERDGIGTWWYENGQKRKESTYKEGKLMTSTSWKPNGEKCPITNILGGNGVNVDYDENGQKDSQSNYKDGKMNGLSTWWWHKDGRGHKWIQSNFKDGKRDGLLIKWFENGQKQEESTYKDGKLDGLLTWWNVFGQEVREVNFKNGKKDGLATFWNKNGQKEEESTYKDGKREGLSTWWLKDGQKQTESNYKDGQLDGLETTWEKNGQKKEERNYKDGILDGLSTKWYENGQKKLEENYKENKLIHAKVWLPDGKECPESKVIDGKGMLVTYSLEGKEISRLNFKDGIRRFKIPPPGRIPKRPLVLSEANSTTRPRFMPPRSQPPLKLPDRLRKRPASSEANSSKPTPPSLPPWLVPAAPK